MADFANWQQPQGPEPSVIGSMYGSPAKAWWTTQKFSMLSTFASGKMWKAAEMGKGIQWGGIVGFRGLAMGESAAPSVLRSASPLRRGVLGVMKGIGASEETISNFKTFGLFGKNSNKGLSFVGRLVGGGTIESTAFTAIPKQDRITQILMKEGFNSSDIKLLRASRYKSELFGSYRNLKRFVGSDELKGINGMYRGVSDDTKLAAETIFKARNAERAIVSKELTKRMWVRRLAKVGKLASWVTAATIAFDVGSALGGFATNAAGNIASRLESSLGAVVNRKMEFGGKVGIGFYSGRSGTERQRALAAIGNSGGQSYMGNEAGYQHVDSTW